MSEAETCQDSDSSSSSSSRKGGFLSVTNNSSPQGQQQQQEISLPQQQQQHQQKLSSSAPVSPFSTNNNNTPKSNTSKPLIRPKIMQQKLDIPPRQFAALNVKSVVSVTNNNNNNTNLSNSTSPGRFSSISSASVNSQQQQQQQHQQNQQALQQDSAASSFSCSSSAMQSPQPQQTSNFQFAPVTTDGQLEQQQRSSNNFNASLVHPRIYLGSAMDAMYAAELVARGIFYILNVAYECDFSDSVLACDRIKTKKIDLRDTISENIERSFDEAFAFIDEAVNDRNHDSKILVHCFIGSSRSPSVVIAYLMKKLAEQDQQQQCKHEHEQQQQQQFTHIKNSIITLHQEQVHRQNQGSPTMMDALLAPQHSQRQQQQQDDDDPFAHVDESAIASFVIASTSQQHQHQKAQSNFPSTSTSSSTSSTSSTTSSSSSSYYRSVLGRVQRIRPEVLPNFAFACALQRMDDQLLLRATA